MLSDDEIERYQRHLVLKKIGGPGQNRLNSARILVIGAGGLGSPILQYLAAAGIGKLSIVDGDRVSVSNLQRQTIHGTSDVGSFKVDSAAKFIAALNPHVNVTVSRQMVGSVEDILSIVCAHDVVLDCTDNFETRAIIASTCESAKKPLVSGAVNMFDGQVTVFAPHLERAEGEFYPGFKDLYPSISNADALPKCEDVGILGAVTGVIGTLMSMEAIKLVTGVGTPLFGRMMMYDGQSANFREIRYKRRTLKPETPSTD